MKKEIPEMNETNLNKIINCIYTKHHYYVDFSMAGDVYANMNADDIIAHWNVVINDAIAIAEWFSMFEEFEMTDESNYHIGRLLSESFGFSTSTPQSIFHFHQVVQAEEDKMRVIDAARILEGKYFDFIRLYYYKTGQPVPIINY